MGNLITYPEYKSCAKNDHLSQKTSSLTAISRFLGKSPKFCHGFVKEEEQSWTGSFAFIQGADTQFGMIDFMKGETIITWDEEIKRAKRCIEAINAMNPRPKFFVICGDLVDGRPGTKYNSAQVKDFIEVFKELHPDIPLICVCGNHDIGNRPTRKNIQNYRAKFGDDYFTFYCSGVMFIVLNSQYYQDPRSVQDLAEEQEIWLDQQLEEAKSGKYKHVIIFQHIPWFIERPDEQEIYLRMQALHVKTEVREKMLQKFYEAGVRAIFCGHYHSNGGGFYKDLEQVVTSAVGCQLGSDKSGFRLVKIDENSIKHQYYAFEDAPKDIFFY